MPPLVIVLVIDTRAVVIVFVFAADAMAIVFNVDAGAVMCGAHIEGDAVALSQLGAGACRLRSPSSQGGMRCCWGHGRAQASPRWRGPSMAVRTLCHSVAVRGCK
ncbi:hypothetical protein EDB83DRAFT_2407356 [Lactarius deliciosus]|nr:hypothetical protein EDB83DRAFT_2407356 [Lactarius deliciosus]